MRDYDPSLPDLVGDREQLIQAVLNIVRNAAQALVAAGSRAGREGTITLRTRAVRQVTMLRQRHKLALELQVIDDGPGVPEDIRDRIFNPAGVGAGRRHRAGTLAGADLRAATTRASIECDSRPGRTVFRILLPLA